MKIVIKDIEGYVPFFRLSGEEIRNQAGVRAPNEKAFCSYDEDPLTLSYEASYRIVKKFSNYLKDKRSALIFVSSSFNHWLEKNPSVTLSRALDLPVSTATISIGGGTEGIISAFELAYSLLKSHLADCVLIATGERRRGAEWDIDFGLSDGGGAIFMTATSESEDGIFSVDDFFHISEETPAISSENGKILCVDERFVATEVYSFLIKKVFSPDLKVVFSSPTFGIALQVMRTFKIKDDVFSAFGSFGNSQIPISLAYSTGFLKKGDKVAVLGLGNGVKGVILTFQGNSLPHREIIKVFERRKKMRFGHYLKVKDIIGFPEDESSISLLWREREQNLSLYGLRCSDCGNSIFPAQIYCQVCGSKNLSKEKMSREGEVFTFTEDYLTTYADVFPPLPMLVVRTENGARIYVQGIELEDGERFSIGDKVELTLRILNVWKGFRNYFYKARKKREF
jgi:uncharacterized OB-fold protein/3-hydroxy-3-methylglutaryl CoA synthase